MTKLRKIATCVDGGTLVYIDINHNIQNPEDVEKFIYYVDGRHKSSTKGELFKGYPSEEDSIILNKEYYEFI